jgi:hypothetical protein
MKCDGHKCTPTSHQVKNGELWRVSCAPGAPSLQSAMQIDHDLILCKGSCVENGSVKLQWTYKGINIDG